VEAPGSRASRTRHDGQPRPARRSRTPGLRRAPEPAEHSAMNSSCVVPHGLQRAVLAHRSHYGSSAAEADNVVTVVLLRLRARPAMLVSVLALRDVGTGGSYLNVWAAQPVLRTVSVAVRVIGRPSGFADRR
jgi:hypothetical protein